MEKKGLVYCDDCNCIEEGGYIDSLGKTLCNDCLENNYVKCKNCDEYFEEVSKSGLCESCQDEADEEIKELKERSKEAVKELIAELETV